MTHRARRVHVEAAPEYQAAVPLSSRFPACSAGASFGSGKIAIPATGSYAAAPIRVRP